MSDENLLKPASERLLSLDFFRGVTMFLLIGASADIFNWLIDHVFDNTIWQRITIPFEHHPWNGLRFWDLIQPFFMFIVGVAMPFSYGKRWEKGEEWSKTLTHAIRRSLLLFALGVGLPCVWSGKMTFELWNVLAQLSFTFLVAFLMMRKSIKIQLIFSFGLLILTEALFRMFSMPGYNQPFVMDHNFGTYVDMLLMGKVSGGGWLAFNCVPTTAHTMWGVIAGLILKSNRLPYQKIKILLIAGIIGLVVGYGLNPVTPIIKRICTSSFVIVSGGWCLVALAFSYWFADIKKFQSVPKFFAVVGLNPLFIYLFTDVGGSKMLHKMAYPFVNGLLGWKIGPIPSHVVTALVVWWMLWYICYFMDKHKVYVRI